MRTAGLSRFSDFARVVNRSESLIEFQSISAKPSIRLFLIHGLA